MYFSCVFITSHQLQCPLLKMECFLYFKIQSRKSNSISNSNLFYKVQQNVQVQTIHSTNEWIPSCHPSRSLFVIWPSLVRMTIKTYHAMPDQLSIDRANN